MPRKSSEILLKDLLAESSNSPLYIQLYESIRSAVLNGRLKPGEKLPSTRDISNYLSLSRSTVIKAFDMLLSEGYIIGKTGAGSFVNEQLPERFTNVTRGKSKKKSNSSDPVPLSNYGERIDKINFGNNYPGEVVPFQPGIPSLIDFPHDIWSKLTSKSIRELRAMQMTYTESIGLEPLRKSISSYLRQSRGVNCNSNNIIITNGAQQSIDLIGRMLLDENNNIIIEDPAYSGAAKSLASTGAKIKYVPVDVEGINVNEIVKAKPIPKLIYVTPSHQYPLGYTMSLKRRMQLLEWAAKNSIIIVEDDYDSEFRYTGNPLSSLQGMDQNQNVIYIGTFSKVLFPSIRIGYMVLPERLMEIFTKAKALADRNSPMLEQLILSRFMAEGHFGRYLRKMRLVYQERQEALVNHFNKKLGEFGKIKICQAGLHSVAHLNNKIKAERISDVASKEKLCLPALSSYSKQRSDLNGLVFGYAAFTPKKIIEGIDRLKGIVTSLKI